MIITKTAQDRIAKGTQYTERVVKNRRTKTRLTPAPQDLGFWAKLTSQQDNRYSWQAVAPLGIESLTEKVPAWQVDLTWGSGSATDTEGFAVELGWQTEYAIIGDIVWMYPAKNMPYYIFNYNPQPKLCLLNGILPAGTAAAPSSVSSGVTIKTYNSVSNTYSSVSQVILLHNNYRTAIGSASTRWLWINYNYGVWWVLTSDCTNNT